MRKLLVDYLCLKYENRILIRDKDSILKIDDYYNIFPENNFIVYYYTNKANFRIMYEEEIKNASIKIVVIVANNDYVPYDIETAFYNIDLGLSNLFPKVDSKVLKKSKVDLDLFSIAYSNIYDRFSTLEETENFLDFKVFTQANAIKYIENIESELRNKLGNEDIDYRFWLDISRIKGKTEYIAAKCNVKIDLSFIDYEFSKFINNEFNFMSGIVSKSTPLLVNKVMDFVFADKSKNVLIILDGMSVCDFYVISEGFEDISYNLQFMYAMIPTTTAISRQSLLTGKLPAELSHPFDLSQEQNGFKQKALEIGYTKNEIEYLRGYDSTASIHSKCIAIILNDIDDTVHNQLNARRGMYQDVREFTATRKLQNLINDLLVKGFNVYLTSDHGNTLCEGVGVSRKHGVEVETKSNRMIVYKDFVIDSQISEKLKLKKYPGYYLDKSYNYYICDVGFSMDIEGKKIMTHGGISVDEIIIPFVKIGEKNE